MTGEGSHEEIGQHFSRTNIFVLVPGGKHSTAQVQEHGQEVGVDCKEVSRPTKTPEVLQLISRKI